MVRCPGLHLQAEPEGLENRVPKERLRVLPISFAIFPKPLASAIQPVFSRGDRAYEGLNSFTDHA